MKISELGKKRGTGRTIKMLNRMIIGGEIPLRFVQLLQDCIFETEYECNRANYFSQLGYSKHNPTFPIGILAEIQTHTNGYISYVLWDNNNVNDIVFFNDFDYEKCMKWMIETIENVKRDVL